MDDGKEPYPENISETTQGHPEEPYMDDDLIIEYDDETLQRAQKALSETDNPEEQTYLEAFITVAQYRADPTFDDPLTR